jgi:hypothetical protein
VVRVNGVPTVFPVKDGEPRDPNNILKVHTIAISFSLIVHVNFFFIWFLVFSFRFVALLLTA